MQDRLVEFSAYSYPTHRHLYATFQISTTISLTPLVSIK